MVSTMVPGADEDFGDLGKWKGLSASVMRDAHERRVDRGSDMRFEYSRKEA